LVVMKFGGSSLQSGEAFQLIAKIIREHSFSRRIVVLSAIGGVTDQLLQATEEALKNEKSIDASVQAIRKIHEPIIKESILDPELHKSVFDKMNSLLDKLHRLLKGAAYTNEATPRNRDHIVTIGERMSVAIMTGCLKSLGLNAVPVETDQIGMLTEGQWGNGTVQLLNARKKLSPFFKALFKENRIPVVTGFFGETADGHPITFGRGGTDYSAAVIASAIHAERLEIWKDVDGFLSGSPEIVKDWHFLSSLSYDEAAELAYFGAKILHPRTVEPLLEKSIPIVIRNTFKPKGVGTWISPSRKVVEGIVKSVTYDRSIAILRIHGVDVGYTVGLLSRLVSHLSELDINIRSVMTSQTCINILLDRKDLKEGYHHLHSLNLEAVNQVEVVENVGMVAIVGEGLSTTEEKLGQAIMALTGSGIHVEMIVSGASKVASYFVVREEKIKDAVRVVHQAFFESK